MKNSFKQKEVEISFRKFKDYASDVLNSNFHTFDTRFDIFLNHCEVDPIIKIITSPLKEMDVGFQQWFDEGQKTGGSFVGSKKFQLPVDEKMRDALLYQFLLKVKSGEISFRSYCSDFFGDSKFDTMIQSFNTAIFYPLVRSVGYKLEEISDSIETDLVARQEVPITMLNVFNDNKVIIGSDNKFGGDAVIGGKSSLEK